VTIAITRIEKWTNFCAFTNVRQGEKSVKNTMKKVINIDMQGKTTKSKIYEVRTR